MNNNKKTCRCDHSAAILSNHKSGRFAELLAQNFLRFQGYQIIASNHITGYGIDAGEVDFIALKDNLLVFVEVKKRTTIETAAYSITPKQINRIRFAAEVFLQKHPRFSNHDIRFDAILIELPLTIHHLENAF